MSLKDYKPSNTSNNSPEPAEFLFDNSFSCGSDAECELLDEDSSDEN